MTEAPQAKTELADHLHTMRAELVATMAADLAAGCDIHSWLPVLAQIQTALVAVEAVENADAGAP